MLQYVKRPGERYSVAVDFASKLPTGASLASGSLTAVNKEAGTDVAASVLDSTTATISGTKASFRGQNGTTETDYLITLTVVLTDGSILIEEILMQVRIGMTIVATAGAVDANSYCTRAEADQYHRTHLYNGAWIQADDWKRDAALIWATRLLDEQVEWDGSIVSSAQSLRWPRGGVTSPDGIAYSSTSIPAWLKQAAAELARHLLSGDRTQERSIGIQSVTADTVQVTFDKTDVKPILPPSVRSIVERFGTVRGPGACNVKVIRA